MKTSVFEQSKIVESFLKSETKKHEFCFLIHYPTESMVHKEFCEIAGLKEDRLDHDGHILVIKAKDMDEMKSLWDKMADKGVQAHALAFKKGKQFTW